MGAGVLRRPEEYTAWSHSGCQPARSGAGRGPVETEANQKLVITA